MKVSACGAYFPDSLIVPMVRDLSRWGVEVHLWALSSTTPEVAEQTRGSGAIGKFLVLNQLLTHVTDADIVLFVDDDVAIGPEFVPRYLAAVEALGLSLAQPALSLGSYYSHQITRRQSDRWARLTNFVEIGPIFSMTRELLDLVTPFPESNPMGWGLEAHWSSIIRERGLKMGIVDACPVEHSFRPVNSTYLADQARRDMCEYLENYRFVWHPMETHRNFIAIPTTREEYLHCYPAPPEALGHAEGGDSEADLPLLWAVAALVRPRTTLELGTRWGEGTRVLAHAAAQWGGRVVTVDPFDARPHLNGVKCEFVQARGEDYFRQWDVPLDLLFIDTDPHTYDQTRHWLETWVAGCLAPGGVAVFHDIVAARPEIQVAEAVRDWVGEQAGGWRWQEFPGTWGLGLLWKTTDTPDFESILA